MLVIKLLYPDITQVEAADIVVPHGMATASSIGET